MWPHLALIEENVFPQCLQVYRGERFSIGQWGNKERNKKWKVGSECEWGSECGWWIYRWWSHEGTFFFFWLGRDHFFVVSSMNRPTSEFVFRKKLFVVDLKFRLNQHTYTNRNEKPWFRTFSFLTFFLLWESNLISYFTHEGILNVWKPRPIIEKWMLAWDLGDHHFSQKIKNLYMQHFLYINNHFKLTCFVTILKRMAPTMMGHLVMLSLKHSVQCYTSVQIGKKRCLVLRFKLLLLGMYC